MPKPIATWNRARDVWETDQASICGHWAAFSETWPISGMTHSGAAYELPTSAPRTDDSASSLLPTPESADASGGRVSTELGGVRESGAKRAITLGAAVHHQLLPTPRTSDTNGPGAHGDGGMDLRTVATLLPTPRATDGTKGGPNQRGSSGDLMLPSAVQSIGASTVPPSVAGNPSSDDRHQHLPSPEAVADSDYLPFSSSGSWASQPAMSPTSPGSAATTS